MKKTKYLLLSFLLLLPLSGCSSKSNPEDTIKALQEKGYLLLTTYDSKNYYDTEGTCYSKDGIEKDESRILQVYKQPRIMLVNTEGSGILNVDWDEDEKNLKNLQYIDDNKIYSVNFDEKLKSVYLFSDYKTDEKACTVYYEGKQSEDSTASVCSSSRTKEADNFKKEYDSIFTDADVSEDDFIDALTFVKDNSAKDLEKTLKNKVKNQKELTNEEVKKALETNKFTITKNADTTITVSKRSDDGFYNISISSILDDSKEPYALMYIYDLYYKDFSTNEGKRMFYGYYFNSKQEVALGVDNDYAYSLTDEKSIGTATCSKEFADTAGTLQFTFEEHLSDSEITLDELVNFLKTY